MNRVRPLAAVLPALIPGACVLALAFQSGGFFPDSWSAIGFVAAVVLALRVVIVERPFEGFSAFSGVAVGALALFGIWILLSSLWSDAGGRATGNSPVVGSDGAAGSAVSDAGCSARGSRAGRPVASATAFSSSGDSRCEGVPSSSSFMYMRAWSRACRHVTTAPVPLPSISAIDQDWLPPMSRYAS